MLMMYRKLLIFLLICQQAYTMDKPTKVRSKPISYQSVVPFSSSGRIIPSLQVLAAQQVHEMNRAGLLTREQLARLAQSEKKDPSIDVVISNVVLQQDFSQMSKDKAGQYAFDLSSGRVPRSGSSGRVKQKVLAIEINTKLNR